MFGKSQSNNYGRWIALIGGVVGTGVAIAAIPMLKKRAMRATTILKKDHRVVSGLFWTLHQTPNGSIRKSIFNQIQSQLDIHTLAEEEVFYPAVRALYTANSE